MVKRLEGLQQLTSLDIQVEEASDTNQENENVNEIDNFSFICRMPNLTVIYLENIKLPDDLTPFFSHHFSAITFRHCNVTESNFSNLDANAVYPDHLDLADNQISDATIFTNMQWDWGGNNVYYLVLNGNPLTKLGDRIGTESPSFETFDFLASGQNAIGLSLTDTDFEEYTFAWYRD